MNWKGFFVINVKTIAIDLALLIFGVYLLYISVPLCDCAGQCVCPYTAKGDIYGLSVIIISVIHFIINLTRTIINKAQK